MDKEKIFRWRRLGAIYKHEQILKTKRVRRRSSVDNPAATDKELKNSKRQLDKLLALEARRNG